MLNRLFLLFLIPCVLLASEKSMEEDRLQNLIKAYRDSGFADYEIDNLHKSIRDNMRAIKAYVDKGLDKENARYLEDIPKKDLPDLFKIDSQGKQYLELDIGQGESFADYPKTYLFDTRAFIYLAQDMTVEKVIVQFKRTNSRGTYFIREMRRIVNPSPKVNEPDDQGNKKLDDNNDIFLEYYTSNDGVSNWPDVPVLESKPGLSVVFNDKENPMPFMRQRTILEKYRKVIRKGEKAVAYRLYRLELDRKRMASKMVDF